MNNKNSIEHVLIAGRGYTPVLTALFLQKKWGQLAPRITLLQCGENADPPIISCVSSIRGFHRELGIAEKDFVRKTEASFHLGTIYEFAGGHPDFFMCEASYGVNIQAIRFNHWFLRYLNSGKDARYDDFCINAQLAKRGHFALTSPKPESVYSQVCYGYKIQSARYSRYLVSQLDTRINVIEDKVKAVQSGEEGIEQILLENGLTLTADLYIDTTTEHLLAREICEPFKPALAESWSIEDSPGFSLGPPHNHLKLGNGKLETSTLLHGKRYRHEIQCDQNGPPKWWSGLQPWQKNCLMIGPATSSRPSLLIDPIHLVASSLYRLYMSWPTCKDFGAPASIYNEHFAEEQTRIEDSDAMHCWAAHDRNNKCLTDGASHRMRIFANDGRIPLYENESMTEEQWAALFAAFGISANVPDPLTEGSNDRWLVEQLDKLRETLQAAAQHAPRLEAFYKKEVIGL